jgi:hypothetical protein
MGLASGCTVSLLPPFSCVLSLSHCRSLVSKTIIDHHEGRIGVSSELGKGSTFYFELKLHSSPTTTPAGLRPGTCPERVSNVILESPSPSLNDISSKFFLSHRLSRVLVVDDSKLNRKMLSRQLKDYFLEIVEVEPILYLCFYLP